MPHKQQYIKISGARVNNLKNISLQIPRDKFTVITGVSGSGKSSLAFDTLYAEGQRRFAESLSSFARQFLGRISKPDVDKIDGIPPAVAIAQKVNTKNPRSTVGTSTEIYDYLRVLYAKIGKTISPKTGREIKKHSIEDVVQNILAQPIGSLQYILVDSDISQNNEPTEYLLNLKKNGYSRLFAVKSKSSGQLIKIDDYLTRKNQFAHAKIYPLVSRFIIDKELDISQVRDNIAKAFSEGNGRLVIVSATSDKIVDISNFSNKFEEDGIIYEEPSEAMFSFNSPIGACPVCGGYGECEGIDEKLVIPNASLSVYEDCVAPWRGKIMGWYKDQLIQNSKKFNFPIHRPYASLTAQQKELIWRGNEYFTGIYDFFEWVESKKYKIQFRYLLSRYKGKSVCRACGGSRLKSEVRNVKIEGKSLFDLLNMSVDNLLIFFKNIALDKYDSVVAQRPIKEIIQRLEYIQDVGLGYLTLNRKTKTLSGGESQRINLVGCLGNSLVGSLYILDEPSVGLHPSDTQRLISILKKLRDLGNTIVVVEHDADIIKAADHLIDIGPAAGSNGGEIVYQGAPTTSKVPNSKSLTLAYLNGDLKVNQNEKPRSWKNSIQIAGAMENNLKNITAQFPLGVLSVVTGVSGSGKSSLVGDVLYPALCRHFELMTKYVGAYKSLSGDLDKIDGVEYIDQNPMGKSARSNPVTYLKIYDDIRKLFSDQPYAKLNGYTNSYFSFNMDGGRCPTCLGDGYITIPMQFMADVTMVCEECEGKRFKSDILEVRYKGLNISDVLDLTVDQAIDFFSKQKEPTAERIVRDLSVLEKVGLGYIKLGQSSSTLSGGECQRVMLANFLSRGMVGKGRKFYIFDEPTTGLHFSDIKKLLTSLNALVDAGNSVLVVEHNTEIIKSADWIIDLGPGSGDAGGEIIFTGTPQDLKSEKRWEPYL